MKKDYLVVYDYGTGGVWSVIHARSPEDIPKKFPELTVVETRPAWLTDELYEKCKKNRYIDIDDEPTGWFSGLKKL